MTEERALSDIRRTLAVSVTHVLLHASTVGTRERPDVPLHHSNPGDRGVTDRILLSDGSRRHRSMRERRLQGIQKVYHDVDKLETEKSDRACTTRYSRDIPQNSRG